MRYAFKEWAAICHMLAQGWQSLILRKGGIEEIGGEFRVEHDRFWLYPTYMHQQTTGLVPAALPVLEKVKANRPPPGTLRLGHFAQVVEVHQVRELDRALALGGLHFWSEPTVRQRFEYRHPGLYVLAVRIHALPAPVELPERPEYEGCRSWVELAEDVSEAGAVPVLSDEAFAARLAAIRTALGLPL